LSIPCYTQVYWNEDADQHIYFNDTVQNGSWNGGDWYRATADGLTGAYGAATQASQDAWASGYYESDDKAFFWLDTNCDVTMQLTSGGNLSTAGGDELPTWYTVALTNNLGCTCLTDCGFINNGTRQSVAAIPGDCEGYYGDDANADYAMEHMGTHYPNQYSFPMEDGGGNPTTYAMGFDAYAQGTILFHARVLRSGLADAGGDYTTTLNVHVF